MALAVVHIEELKSEGATQADKAFLTKMVLDRLQTGFLSSSWAALAARR